MANCENFNLPLVEFEPHQAREALRCVLYTILFNRALGMVTPRDVDADLFDITYVHCGDPEVERVVEAKINEICLAIERKPADVTQLCLAFFERRRTKAWFGTSDERLYWEQWYINVAVLQPELTMQQGSRSQEAARAARQSRSQAALEAAMTYVVRAVNDKKDHIPPVVASTAVTFPFDITLCGGNHSTFGLGAVKRMLLQTSPPPVLS